MDLYKQTKKNWISLKLIPSLGVHHQILNNVFISFSYFVSHQRKGWCLGSRQKILEKGNDNVKLRCALKVGHEPFLSIFFCNIAVVFWVIKSTCRFKEGDLVLKLIFSLVFGSFWFSFEGNLTLSLSWISADTKVESCWAPFPIHNSTIKKKIISFEKKVWLSRIQTCSARLVCKAF